MNLVTSSGIQFIFIVFECSLHFEQCSVKQYFVNLAK